MDNISANPPQGGPPAEAVDAQRKNRFADFLLFIEITGVTQKVVLAVLETAAERCRHAGLPVVLPPAGGEGLTELGPAGWIPVHLLEGRSDPLPRTSLGIAQGRGLNAVLFCLTARSVAAEVGEAVAIILIDADGTEIPMTFNEDLPLLAMFGNPVTTRDVLEDLNLVVRRIAWTKLQVPDDGGF